jgi:hypothetical protein
LKDGIPLPPFRTCRATVDSSGLSSSRFGPTWPLAPATFSVWQPAQPADAKTLAPGSFFAASLLLPPLFFELALHRPGTSIR